MYFLNLEIVHLVNGLGAIWGFSRFLTCFLSSTSLHLNNYDHGRTEDLERVDVDVFVKLKPIGPKMKRRRSSLVVLCKFYAVSSSKDDRENMKPLELKPLGRGSGNLFSGSGLGEGELVGVGVHDRGNILVLLLTAEVVLYDVEGLLVDLHVLVALEEFYLVEAEYLLNDDSVGVGAATLLRLLLSKS